VYLVAGGGVLVLVTTAWGQLVGKGLLDLRGAQGPLPVVVTNSRVAVTGQINSYVMYDDGFYRAGVSNPIPRFVALANRCMHRV